MKKNSLKWTGLFLAALVMVSLAGCGQEGKNMDNTVTPEPTAGSAATPEPTPFVTEGAGEDGQNNNGGQAFSLSDAVRQAAGELIGQASDMTKRSMRAAGNTHRLQQVFEKMQSGEEVAVAYLGGSITEGYLVNSKQNYAYKTTEWLKSVFGNDKIKHINAGLSGTSSTIGLLRVQQDVLDYGPELVFVEFAVNDAQDSTSKLMYESLVSRIVNSDSAPAVVLIFTRLENGYTCEKHMSAVGEAYNLPMISVDAALAAELEAGTLAWADYAQDEAHPTNNGHTIIADFIKYLFSNVMVKETLDADMDYTSCKVSGDPYAGMNFYNNENLAVSDLGGFIEANSDISHFPHDWLWNKAEGESLKFSMNGKNLVLLYKESNNAQNMARIEVYIDGKLKGKVDGYSESGWNNPQTALVFNEVAEGEHEVEIRVTEDTMDKNFHILGLGTTGTLLGVERVDEKDIPYQERAIVNVGNTYKLQRLMARAEAGESLTIGFIGGSITMGSGASNANKCYAKLVYDWWCDTYPQAEFTYVNAGIGATTSQFGCARVGDDLLSYKPDFVIVEFSVNDDGNAVYGETYESLVRRILTDDCQPAVMVLNMVQYDSGVNAQLVHNEIAGKYGLPAVSMRESIYKEITFGNLAAKDISGDMLHPNDRGHAYGAEIVTYFLGKVKDGSYASEEAALLPEPIYSLKSMASVRLDSRNTTPVLNGFVGDTAAQNGITDIFKNGYTAKQEDSSILFEGLTGSTICIQYRKTNALGAPKAVAIIDGNEAGAATLDGNFPNGWGNWLYMHTLASDLDPSVPHTLEIRITEGADRDFYLVSVIVSGQ